METSYDRLGKGSEVVSWGNHVTLWIFKGGKEWRGCDEVGKAAAEVTRKIPSLAESIGGGGGGGEGELFISTSALHCHSLGNINMPFATEPKSLCH